MARLNISINGKKIPLNLNGTETTIGRGVSCDLQLHLPEISRSHCRISQIENNFWIKDLNSKNGTFVNGHKIENTDLCEGDAIRIGSLEFKFSLIEDNPISETESLSDVLRILVENHSSSCRDKK